MKKVILLLLVFTAYSYAQNAYTLHWYLTKIAAGTANYADTLNHNWDIVDSIGNATNDTISAVKGDLYAEHKYDGTHKDNTIRWTNLHTTDKNTYIMQLSNNQTVNGLKTFGGGIAFSPSARFLLGTSTTYTAQGELYRTGTAGADLLTFWYGASLKDTLASRRWVRATYPTVANSVTTNTTQTITGRKTFVGNVYLDGYVRIPQRNEELPNMIWGNGSHVYYSKTGGSMDFDTLFTWTDLTATSFYNLNPKYNEQGTVGYTGKRWLGGNFKSLQVETLVTSDWRPASGETEINISGAVRISSDTLGLKIGSKIIPTDTIYAKAIYNANDAVGIYGKGLYVDSSFYANPFTINGITGTDTTITLLGYINWLESTTAATVNNLTPPISKDGVMCIVVGVDGGLTLVNATGNLKLQGDIILDKYDAITLMYDNGNSRWYEISRTDR